MDGNPGRPRTRIAGPEVWALAEAEYRRMLELIRTLEGDDWTRQTDCTAWDVRAMLGHLVGAAEGYASPRQFLHQYWTGWRRLRHREVDGGHYLVDGANDVQVRERAGATTQELITRYERAIPKAMAWRRRYRRLPGTQPDEGGRFTLRELFEVILTRDTWMHRVDLCRATGREFVVTAEHDGRLVEDCVLDWAGKHGRPFCLHLTGPAGGDFEAGTGGPVVEADAIGFVRALSGRDPGQEILGTRVVF